MHKSACLDEYPRNCFFLLRFHFFNFKSGTLLTALHLLDTVGRPRTVLAEGKLKVCAKVTDTTLNLYAFLFDCYN